MRKPCEIAAVPVIVPRNEHMERQLVVLCAHLANDGVDRADRFTQLLQCPLQSVPERATADMSRKLEVGPLILRPRNCRPTPVLPKPFLSTEAISHPGKPPLANKMHERFAQVVASGTFLSDAYRKVYGRRGISARVGGSRLNARENV